MFSALATAFLRGAWVDPSARFAGLGDPPLFIWYLRWVPHALAHGQNPWFTDHMNYPAGFNVMWNTAMPLAGVVLAPITAVFGPIVSYNVLVTAGYALSAFAAYIAVRRFVDHRAAAVLAGLVYGFSPYMVLQSYSHAHLIVAFVPPLLLVVLHELLVEQRWALWKTGAALGLLVTAQFLLAEEMLLAEALVAGLTSVGLVVLYRGRVRAKAAYALKALAVGGVIAGVLCAWPLVAQFRGPQHLGPGAIQPEDTFVSDLAGFVVPTFQQWISPSSAAHIYRRFTPTTIGVEWNAYVGLPLLVLAGAMAVVWRRRPIVVVSALSALGIAVLSLGPYLHVAGHDYLAVKLPWRLVREVPLATHMLPGRLILYAWVFLALLIGLFVDAVLARRGCRLVAGVAVTAVVLLPLIPLAPPYTPSPVPSFFTAGGGVHRLPPGSVAVVAPWSTGDVTDDAPMIWQAAADMRFKMPSGYSIRPDRVDNRPAFGPVPTILGRALGQLKGGETIGTDEPTLDAMRAEIRGWKTRAVIVGPIANESRVVDYLTLLLGRRPERTGGVWVWWLSAD
jgi:hypothetical protein